MSKRLRSSPIGSDLGSGKKYGRPKRMLASWFYDENKEPPSNNVPLTDDASVKRIGVDLPFSITKLERDDSNEVINLRKTLLAMKQENSKLACQLNASLETARQQSLVSRNLNIKIRQLERELIHAKVEMAKLRPNVSTTGNDAPFPHNPDSQCEDQGYIAISNSNIKKLSFEDDSRSEISLSKNILAMDDSPNVSTTGNDAPFPHNPDPQYEDHGYIAISNNNIKKLNFEDDSHSEISLSKDILIMDDSPAKRDKTTVPECQEGRILCGISEASIFESIQNFDVDATCIDNQNEESITTSQDKDVRVSINDQPSHESSSQESFESSLSVRSSRPSRRAVRVTSYKEPSLNSKMRRTEDGKIIVVGHPRKHNSS